MADQFKCRALNKICDHLWISVSNSIKTQETYIYADKQIMEIDPNIDMTSLSTSLCQEKVQSEVQVKLLKESLEFEKNISSKLLQAMGIGQHIDTVA